MVFGKLCSLIIRLKCSPVKWNHPDGPFHHAEYRLLRTVFLHWRWQHLFFYTFVISHAVTLLHLSNCFFLSRSVCFTIKKNHLVPGSLIDTLSNGQRYCILQPTLGSCAWSIPFLSLFVCTERLFCSICDLLQRFSRHAIAYISSCGKNMASSAARHCYGYGCIKYPYVPEILTSRSLNGRRAFHVFEDMRSFTIITQKIASSAHFLSLLHFLRGKITTHNISEIRIFSFLCNWTAAPMNI